MVVHGGRYGPVYSLAACSLSPEAYRWASGPATVGHRPLGSRAHKARQVLAPLPWAGARPELMRTWPRVG